MATNTAATFTSHTGNNSAGPFSISFSYLSEDEIDVTVGGVLKTKTTHYTFPSATTISFTSGNHPSNGAAIKFQRDTNISAKKVDFVDGSVLTEADLDTNTDHLLYGIQEVLNHVDTKEFTSAQIQDGTIVNADVNASAAIDGTKISPNFGSQNIVTTGTVDGRDVSVDGAKLDGIDAGAKDDQTAAEIKTLLQSDKLTASEIADGTITATQIATGALDGRYYTETESDAKYFNVSTGDTIKDGDAFPDNDTTIATTAAINDRIVDLVDDVGGFVPIANETSFPAANPDVNNGTGTLVSVKAFDSSHTPSGGSVTIANGAGSGNTVTITGCGSTVLAAGFGGILETTSTLHTYTFHRLTPKATEVTTVATHAPYIQTVSGIAANVTTVSNNSSNVTTVATNITNVNNVGSSIANVNTVATNLTSIQSFEAKYRIASSDPTSSLDVGDLVFNTSSNELRVYNGSAWQGGVTATGDLLSRTSDFLDEDNFATNSATKVASQQSIKAYVDAGDLSLIDEDNFASNSATRPPSQQSVKAYVDTADALKANLSGATFTGDVVFTGDAANVTWDKSTDDLIFNDNAKAIFGTNSDGVSIYHDGSHSYIDETGTGNLMIKTSILKINNPANSEAFIHAYENGDVELFYDGSKKFETESWGVNITGNCQASGSVTGSELTINGTTVLNSSRTLYNLGTLELADNIEARFGTGSDLKIYHDGANSYVSQVTAGQNLFLKGDYVQIRSASNEQIIETAANGAVNLYYDGSKKFETDSNGVNITGQLDLTSNLSILDNSIITIGSGDDLQIYHDATNSIIKNSTGYLILQSDNFKVTNNGDTESIIRGTADGNVELYYDNSKKFETTSSGGTLTGHLTVTGEVIASDDININADNKKLNIGASADLKIYHDGTDSRIHNGTGSLVFRTGSNYIFYNSDASETHAVFSANGAVNLYYDGSKKFETTTNGITVTGSVTETSDVSLKDDINTIQNPLQLIEQIRGINFTWKNNGTKSMGVIAQDVEKVFPELVHGQEGSKSLQYSGLIGALVESVKELSAKVAALESA